jgi:branched-chain amino acid transport system substrate-binding protein
MNDISLSQARNSGGKLLAAVLFATAALTAPSTPAQTAEPAPIRIGVIGPFTGGSADAGTSVRNGVQLAVKEINAAGGLVGRKFELVERDDKADPATARAVAEDLVKQNVIATIGSVNTGPAMAMLEVFQKAKIPLIVSGATGTPITATFPPAESYIFRTSAKDGIQVPFVINDAVKKRGWTRIAVFADKTGYGEAGIKDALAALDAHQLKPAYVYRFDTGATDKSMVDAVKAARDAGAQAIFVLTVGPDTATIARAKEAAGWKGTLIGAWVLSWSVFVDGAKAAGEGSLMAQTFIPEATNDIRASYLAHYRDMFKADAQVPMAAAQSYDATYLLLYGLFTIPIQTPKIDGPMVKHALENIAKTYYGVVATYQNAFTSKDHDALSENMLYLGVVKDGAVTFAYPEDRKRNNIMPRKE